VATNGTDVQDPDGGENEVTQFFVPQSGHNLLIIFSPVKNLLLERANFGFFFGDLSRSSADLSRSSVQIAKEVVKVRLVLVGGWLE